MAGSYRWTEDDLRRIRNIRLVKTAADFSRELQDDLAPKKTKYGSRAVWIDGIRFQSKKEGRFYQDLKYRKAAGEILYFLRQVPFDLPGGVRYRVDFMIRYPDGRLEYIDVKGVRTETYKLKRRQVQALYPVEIIEA